MPYGRGGGAGDVIGFALTYEIFIHISMMPYASAGSWGTLEVAPRAKGLDTRNELIKFYEDNYSANLMHLVIYAKGILFSLCSH